jgi:hypothetical protein
LALIALCAAALIRALGGCNLLNIVCVLANQAGLCPNFQNRRDEMNETGRTLITFAIVLAGALFASAIMLKFSPGSSWLAFVGWSVFFVALQLPWLLVTPSTQSSCTAWLARLRKGE